MASIWVYVETFNGQPLAAAYEALGAAGTLAGALGATVSAVVLGADGAALASALGARGATRVYACNDATLKDFRLEAYAAVLVKLVQEHKPDVLLAGVTSRGRDVFAAAAADLSAPLIADVIALSAVGGQVTATRPVYAGKLLASVVASAAPQFITVRNRAFAAAEAGAGGAAEVIAVPAALSEDQIQVKVLEWLPEAEGEVSLADARIIVSGGRGVSNNGLTPPAGHDPKKVELWRAQEGFKMVGALASVLGGAVGASRAAVDAGYIPYAHQVGQTGRTVSPDLYIACGISGAIQHLAGMRTSKTIVAINKDADAPIFKAAHYGIVGDMFKILPALTEALRVKLGK